MFEHGVDILLAGNIPDRLAELTRFLGPLRIFRRVDGRHLAPALEILAVDDAARAERHDVIALRLVGDDADRIGAGGGAKLHAEDAEPAGGAPHQHVIARLQAMRLVAEQHAIGGRQRQRVAGRLFPGQVLRPRHELAVLHAAELRERAVWRLVTPNALRGREHRVAAIAFLVVAVVLIAMDDNLLANLPALHLRADRPDHARGIGPSDVERRLVHVEWRDRLGKAGPDARVNYAPRPHQGGPG